MSIKGGARPGRMWLRKEQHGDRRGTSNADVGGGLPQNGKLTAEVGGGRRLQCRTVTAKMQSSCRLGVTTDGQSSFRLTLNSPLCYFIELSRKLQCGTQGLID